ncbi:hypothetical protein RvY_10425 [Ramazzottius varieornatus]|uniref:Uncharacterized protein n=1 Tax=Ramazzottius varieornatus TaxID=947166 RepID=A0A1D1VCP9_RAMVA|nr:hypothetical protein RvY_10425 [Ramazzottius varieornatus]
MMRHVLGLDGEEAPEAASTSGQPTTVPTLDVHQTIAAAAPTDSADPRRVKLTLERFAERKFRLLFVGHVESHVGNFLSREQLILQVTVFGRKEQRDIVMNVPVLLCYGVELCEGHSRKRKEMEHSIENLSKVFAVINRTSSAQAFSFPPSKEP